MLIFFFIYLSFLLVPKHDFCWASFHFFPTNFFSLFLKTLKNIEILLALCLCTFSFHQSLIILLILKIFYWDRVSIEFLYITAFIMGGLINYYKLGLINRFCKDIVCLPLYFTMNKKKYVLKPS